MNKNKLIIIPLALVLIFVNITSSSASEILEINLDINSDEVGMLIESYAPVSYLPDSPFYTFVLLKEDIEEAFKPNQLEKIKWKIIIANKRLKEAYLLYKAKDTENASKNIYAFMASLTDIKSSVEKLRGRGDMPIPTIDLENSITNHQKILTYLYNSGLEIPSANAIKAGIELIKISKEEKTD